MLGVAFCGFSYEEEILASAANSGHYVIFAAMSPCSC